MLTHVDLFSGIGGFALAARWAGVETIAFAEIDSYASRVLERHFTGVRNYGDVRNVPAMSAWLVTGGVPCQPASVAGKRLGTADDRWLWPEALAAVERIRPAWVLFENPTGILSLNDGVEFERICLALEGQGYEVQPIVIPACGVGALHRRNRVWILAHNSSNGRGEKRTGRSDSGSAGERKPVGTFQDVANSECRGRRQPTEPVTTERQSFRETERQESAPEFRSGSEDVAYPNGRRREQRNAGERSIPVALAGCDVSDSQPARLEGDERGIMANQGEGRLDAHITGSTWWSVEPDVGRLADGVSDRVGKLRCLGNAIVPQVAYQLIKRMIEAEAHRHA